MKWKEATLEECMIFGASREFVEEDEKDDLVLKLLRNPPPEKPDYAAWVIFTDGTAVCSYSTAQADLSEVTPGYLEEPRFWIWS